MITAGIDMGTKTIKVVIQKNGEVLGRAIAEAGFNASAVARKVLDSALSETNINRSQVAKLIATGAGSEQVPEKDKTVTQVECAVRGARHLFPDVLTVIDVGAEESRAIRCDACGRVVDVAHNEKCAAGAGAFTEALARALETSVDELGPLSRQSKQATSINAQCVVFAESEVVSMIHDNVPKPDMIRAVHDAIAGRIVSMAQKLGKKTPIALVGGLARNVGFVDSLVRGLQVEAVRIPEHPEFCVALGAALTAADEI